MTEEKVDNEEYKSNITFCSICECVFYWRAEDGKLTNICRNCGNTEESKNPIVHENNYHGSQNSSMEYVVNKFCKFDYTLPRTRKIICPNCKKNTEIFYKKYNPISEMALVYGCTECDHYWKK